MIKTLHLVFSLLVITLSASSQSLLHYWSFNNATSETTLLTPDVALISGSSIVHNAGGTSIIDFAGGTGQNFDAQNLNARNSAPAGTHLRFNNPIGGALVFSLPTTGATDIVVKFVTRRSAQGAGTQVVEYTIDGSNYLPFENISVTETPTLEELDFSAIPAVDNNPDFKIRINFEATGGGTGGNNRFDNLTVDGITSGGDVLAPTVVFSPTNNAVNIAVNIQPSITFNEDVRLTDNTPLDNDNVDDIIELRLDNASGTLVGFNATVSGRIITVIPSSNLLNGQQYYLALKPNTVEDLSDNGISSTQSVSFTTIVPQTLLVASDIVPVAYRMNATATEDEIGLLTFVDILPGTLIQLTDSKYTDNAQAQCTNSITWTAPSGGVAAGTVIRIQTSALVASTGTVTGSDFGLSSGGDQVIVYTGTASSPSYITALSSNAWVLSATDCGGSLSKLPAGLTDGSSSVSLSTAPGNVSGNSANAYYNGTQEGTIAELKAAILNPANWLVSASGTAPQTWPAFAFPGPPTVVSATVLNQTTIRVIFNRDLSPATATDLNNFTGISGLASVQQINTVAGPDTLLLTYSTPFVTGSSNTLVIDNVTDTESRTMFAAYSFSFTYSTTIAFTDDFLSVSESDGNIQITLQLANPAVSSADLVLKAAPFSNTDAGDITYATTTLNFTGSSLSTQTITIPVNDDALAEMDEYFVLSLENLSGLALEGKQYLTVYIRDNDRTAPAATEEIKLKYTSSFKPNAQNGSTTEIVAYDPGTKRLFMTSAIEGRMDIASFANPAAITLISSVDMTPYGGITSVAVKNGIVAVASPNADQQQAGSVVFFDTDGVFQKQVTVGALPDMITFTPDGNKVMTANEGQPNNAYTIDPEGSVSIIDISGGIPTLDQSKVTTLLFTAFNADEADLINEGVRKTFAGSTLSQDLEPEFISISPDSKKAWVTLQENNAMGEIDLENNIITRIWPFGKKDFNVFGSGLDASDNSGVVHISNYPLKAFYMPDAVANFTFNNKTYLLTANEGDEKEYGPLNERTTVGNAGVVLDPVIFPNAEVLKEDHNLGRLRITNLNGDNNNDGLYDELVMVGPRSFSIWDADTRTRVYDSGDDFELITSKDPAVSSIFNADNESNTFKSRSRAKGPEPEGAAVVTIDNKVYAFVGLERIGGVMVYNITDPENVSFVDYKNNRSTSSFMGDIGPEGIIYINPTESSDGKPYIIVANELSGTLSIFEVEGVVVLPVSLINFNARARNNTTVELTWSTASEQNNNYFTLEKSTDGVNYKSIAQVKSKGDATYRQDYSYTDLNPSPGINHYRLSQTDLDGRQQIKGVKLVNLSTVMAEWNIYPNPVLSNTITVVAGAYTQPTATFSLFTVTGERITSGRVNVNNGKMDIQLSVKPAAGTYLLNVNGLGTKAIIIKD